MKPAAMHSGPEIAHEGHDRALTLAVHLVVAQPQNDRPPIGQGLEKMGRVYLRAKRKASRFKFFW